MKKELHDRLMACSRRIERLHQLRHMVAQRQGTAPRGHVASAALTAAEFIAAATGNSTETGLVHRAYEEIFAAIESSEAIDEMFRWDRVASYQAPEYHSRLAEILQEFRLRVLDAAEKRDLHE